MHRRGQVTDCKVHRAIHYLQHFITILPSTLHYYITYNTSFLHYLQQFITPLPTTLQYYTTYNTPVLPYLQHSSTTLPTILHVYSKLPPLHYYTSHLGLLDCNTFHISAYCTATSAFMAIFRWNYELRAATLANLQLLRRASAFFKGFIAL